MITKKLLVTLITMVLLSICFGTTAFASELDATLPVQNGTEDKDNIVNTDSNIESQSNGTTEEEAVVEDPELTLGEGYFIDEQGEVYYVEPSDEPEELVIEDIADDTEDSQEDNEPAKKPSYSEKDLRLLTCLIYSEAGNQNYEGMLGVANVVLNRVKSDVYWHAKTIKEVIYDHKWSVQFAVTIKSKSTGLSMLDKALNTYDTRKFTGSNQEAQKKALNRAIKAAKAALEGKNNIGNYLCFQNKRSASSIKKKFSDYKIVGDHIFYRTK
ncbi:MAG: hypothetical protein K0S01_3133 [Herbinix sp.]|jgi:spore germination cell wall hydrolase CwlJ-like protein|nr:hypothetical protein [Herbinix sp.]